MIMIRKGDKEEKGEEKRRRIKRRRKKGKENRIWKREKIILSL